MNRYFFGNPLHTNQNISQTSMKPKSDAFNSNKEARVHIKILGNVASSTKLKISSRIVRWMR